MKSAYEGKVTRKLTSDEQMQLVQRIAWHWRPKEVIKFVKDEFGKTISERLYFQYKLSARWQPIIEKFREDYHKNLTEVPLANKRKRLDELQSMYERAVDHGELLEARNIIKDFRDEMEKRGGDVSFNFTNITHNEFHEMTDEDLQREKVKTLEQLEKVRKLKLLANNGEENGIRREITQEIEEA